MPKAKKKKRLVLLDAHAILHRAYHALPDFSSNKGEPTGALYGLSAMLLKIISELKPDYLISCYDLPEPTHRHEVYEAYKAGRAKADDELVAQMDRSRDVFASFDIPIYEKSGFEADDILGTIVEKVKDRKDLEVIIASGDMDTLQLIDGGGVKVYTLRKGITDTIIYDKKAVIERFGFKPELLTDFKGLRGDPSDNIIGIVGIGEKTATTLIQNFGTIEQMYKKLYKSPKAFEKAGIKPRIVELLKENEEEALFSKELARIRRDAPISFAIPKDEWPISFNPERVLELFSELGFRTLSQRVRTTFNVSESVKSVEESEEVLDSELKETAIALWILNSDITSPELPDILDFARTKSFKEARNKIFAALKKEKSLERVFEEIEKPLIPVISQIDKRGIAVDLPYLRKLSDEYHKDLSKLEGSIWKHAGSEFNINSPRQLGEVLFDTLGLTVKNQKRTGTGQRSTRESELEKMRDLHPIISQILEYRGLQKLLSTYIDNIPHMVGSDGRLHTTFLQSGTTTGRMSSQNPNLQNIPIKTERGRHIRKAFVGDKGYKLVAFDYAQIELKIAAFLSGDEKLIRIFRSGNDVHRAVAAEVFGVPEEQVDSEMRRRAKVINFGILYGMGINALKANLGTDRAEAQRFYNEYFKNFSGLAHYLDRVKGEAARKGYTETLFGRRRYFEGINSTLPHIRAQAERMAINAPMQGTQSDIIKIAMTRINSYLEKEGLLDSVRLLLQVHDELVYEIKEDVLDKVAPKIKDIMESVLPPEKTEGIVLSVETSVGDNWEEMEKL
jgi:DNA polymerase-1|tara:strand:+ start:15143 stop:17509 length:2367 start_codon:yes stop_codon:yes gene_type:complete